VKYSEELQSFYENKKHMLSGESLKLLETNPMLLLASEDEDEKIIATQAPAMLKFLKKDSKAHYAKFKEYLDILEIPYEEDHTLVPENDYSTNSIWEFE
jgi:histidyl-tRNA synthetase